jgi:hypothetical protein
MSKGFKIQQAAHYIAHHEAHKIATKNARKLAKAARYLQGVNEKLVRDTVYRSAYEEIYRDRFQIELIDLVLRNAAAERPTPVVDAFPDLPAIFRLDPKGRA